MIRETMKLKNIISFGLIQAFLLVFNACVPVAKRTECGSNEAFNANLRVCVPTIGTNSSLLYIQSRQPQNNITDQVGSTTTHQFEIVVNDVYSAGYNISWQLRTPNNSVIFLSAGSGTSPGSNRATFTAQTQATQGAGAYQIEANILDNTNSTTLAATSWTINIVSGTVPEIKTISPAGSSYSIVSTQTTASLSMSFTIGSYANIFPRWYVNGELAPNNSPTTSPLSYSSTYGSSAIFDPNANTSNLSIPVTNMNFGVNLVVLNLEDATEVYDTHVWTIYKSYPVLDGIAGSDALNPSTPGVNPNVGGSGSGASPTQVIAIDGVSIVDQGFKLGSDGSDITGGVGRGFCVYVENFTGTQNIPGVSNVFVRFKLDGAQLGGDITFSGNGAANKKCITDATGFNNIALGLPPTLQDIGTTKTISAEICDRGTSGSVNDCGNGYLVKKYNWSIFVRSKNTAPVIASDVGAGSPAATNTTDSDPNNDKVDMVQDLTKRFSITITDDDSQVANNPDFQVRWYINGILMDGINLFPNTSDPTPDCYHTYNDAATIADPVNEKYFCDITVPSYLASGPNNTTSYTVTAVVSDTSKYVGGINKDSNMLTWLLNVSEVQTPPVIQNIYGSTGASADQDFATCFALQSSPDTCIATSETTGSPDLTENQDYILKIRISDAERDNYWRRIEMCKTFVVGQPASTASDCVIISGDQYFQNALYNSPPDGDVTTSEYVFRMPETAIVGALNGQVHFRVTVQDVPTTVAATVIAQKVFSVEVNNNNPQPTINTDTATPKFLPELPLVTYDVYAGMPFTFYPGVVSDPSKADGKNITFQWQVCAGGGSCLSPSEWTDITGATKDKLVWTPPTSLNGATIQIRACIGDDGIGNEVANCPVAAGPWQNIVARKNHIVLKGTTPDAFTHNPSGEMATWYDISQQEPTQYTAYSTGDYPSAGIVVEKVVYIGDGAVPHVEDIKSVYFSTEVSGNAGKASDLSLIGDPTTNSLFVAYKVKDELTIPQNLTTIRIRRIFTQNALFGFDYNGINLGYTLPPGSVTPFQLSPQGANDKTAEIDIVDTAWAGETIEINGFPITEGLDVSLNGLSSDQAAEALATHINNLSDQKVLYKVFATRAGSTVILTGLPTNDYIDVQLYAKKVGSIMYDSTNQKIHLPFIDGLNNDKVSVISLSTLEHLGDANANPINYLQLDSTAGSQDIVNAYSEASGYYYIAAKNYNGYFALYAYDELNSSSVDKKTGSDTAIFSKPIDQLRIGVSSTNNPYVFLGATDTSGNLMLARINENSFLGNTITGSNIEADLINSIKQGTRSQPGGDGDQFKGLSDFRLVSIPDEPQKALLFVSTNNDSVAHIDPSKRNNLYMVKISTDDDEIYTAPITLINTQSLINFPDIDLVSGYNAIENYKISVSPYVKDRTFGLSGYTLNENQKDMVFVNYTVGDSLNPSAISQFINVEEETISATETSFSEGFTPPYIEKIEE